TPATSAWHRSAGVQGCPPRPARSARHRWCGEPLGGARRSARRGDSPKTVAATYTPSAATPQRQRPPPCWIYLPHNPTRCDTAAPTPARTLPAAPIAATSRAPHQSTPLQSLDGHVSPPTKSTINQLTSGAAHQLGGEC